ncbi:MAG: hypothetical protein GYB55_17190 [Cytophagales bacterium]|uniref:hypothetical protein n=1 Tax=Cyclobacterium marinum TaxID=104 RepID=UPI00165999BA|nr:hypothetical protein [Cyclobacterium marinum]MBI0398267.1 hypothetical protein [Cyclobacterium marinum]MBR9776654.1 hypothetical protein [Cytophagales bacterium]|tara:strand:- start:15178 stop:15339 length:162 start_codon:yes stop_codon:yes gene_type:complete
MADQKKKNANLPVNSSPVCYQNEPDIQEDYLLPNPKIKKSKKTIHVDTKKEDQ